MHSESATSDRDTWSRAISLLVLGFICYALPWSVFAGNTPDPVLRIQGSNTIGAKLGPALVRGMLEEQGLRDIRQQPGAANETLILARDASGRELSIQLSAHGSGTGFVALAEGSADLAASSRPAKDAEVQALAGAGDLRSRASEQVIAIDGLAVILHPQNPVQVLSTRQLAAIFAGEINDWEALGGTPGPIRLYARDDNSGTYDTFKELVLALQGKQLAATARRFESSDALSDAVSRDPAGIGFIGLPYIRQSKAVALVDGESQPMPPSVSLIASEDYPLSRRLFFYLKPGVAHPWAAQLVRFAQSPQGQQIVTQNGFVGQRIEAQSVSVGADAPAVYQALARQAKRLSLNFRFQDGSAALDNKAHYDLERLLDYLRSHDKLRNQVVLVGFGDPKANPERAALLSKLRAMEVRRPLARQGVFFREIIGLGDELPVATNSADEGRIKNRRVEVWVY